MFKPIITDQEGQYKYPGVPTVIKGSKTTMRGVPPMLTVTPDGAFYANPNMDYSYLGELGVELPLNKYGGCMDCQEQFPQAQNLNWFYKAQGGEAFPQANMYPESWVGYSGMQYAAGGEMFPQAQTYLPYDRPGETRLNGMFQYGGEDEYGGQADLESIYRIMKAGGLNKDPKKKKGGGESLEQFMMRMGGLPKAQFGPPTQLESFGLKDVLYNDQEDDSVPPAFAANALEDYEPMLKKDIRKIRRDYRRYGVDGPSMETPLDGEEMSGDQLYAGAKGLAGRMERRAARQDERMANDAMRESNKQMRQANRDMRRMNRPYNYNLDMANAYGAGLNPAGLYNTALAVPNAVSLLGDVFGGYKQLFGAKRGYEYPGMQYEDAGEVNPLMNIPESQRFPATSKSNVPLNFMGQPFATGAAEYVPIESLLLPGTPFVKGLGKAGNIVLDAANPVSGMGASNFAGSGIKSAAKNTEVPKQYMTEALGAAAKAPKLTRADFVVGSRDKQAAEIADFIDFASPGVTLDDLIYDSELKDQITHLIRNNRKGVTTDDVLNKLMLNKQYPKTSRALVDPMYVSPTPSIGNKAVVYSNPEFYKSSGTMGGRVPTGDYGLPDAMIRTLQQKLDNHAKRPLVFPMSKEEIKRTKDAIKTLYKQSIQYSPKDYQPFRSSDAVKMGLSPNKDGGYVNEYEEGGYIPEFQASTNQGLGYDPFLNSTTPMQEFAMRYQQQQDSPPTIAEYNQTSQSQSVTGTPTPGTTIKPKKGFDIGMANLMAQSSVNKLNQIANLAQAFNAPDMDELRRRAGSTDMMMTPMTQQNRGYYMTNVGPGTNFRPDQMRYAQKDVNYFDQGPLLNVTRYGGILDELQDGGVYDLTQEEIDAILAAGGSIEYI